MFDIGFWELIVIMIVALLVIGPERLPGVARKVGLLVGKARRFVMSVKADIDREVASEELKRILREQSESTGLHEIIEDTRETLDEAKHDYLVKSTPSPAKPAAEKSIPKPGAIEADSDKSAHNEKEQKG